MVAQFAIWLHNFPGPIYIYIKLQPNTGGNNYPKEMKGLLILVLSIVLVNAGLDLHAPETDTRIEFSADAKHVEFRREMKFKSDVDKTKVSKVYMCLTFRHIMIPEELIRANKNCFFFSFLWSNFIFTCKIIIAIILVIN